MSESSSEQSIPDLPEPMDIEKYDALAAASSASANPISIPTTLRRQIVQRVSAALDSASDKMQRAMNGESVFATDAERKSAMDLIKMLPRLLPLIKKFSDPPDPLAFSIPPCPFCGAAAGQHWAHYCPRIHPSHYGKSVFDYANHRMINLKEAMNVWDIGPDYGT